jgi:Mg2+/Co2+ transporter CorB
MGTRFAHSENHGANQSAAQRRCRSSPARLLATFLIGMNPLINITCM